MYHFYSQKNNPFDKNNFKEFDRRATDDQEIYFMAFLKLINKIPLTDLGIGKVQFYLCVVVAAVVDFRYRD